MTDATDDDSKPEAPAENIVRFAVQTPFGSQLMSSAELPDELRESLVASLKDPSMPDEVRAAIAKALEVELDDPTGLGETPVPIGTQDAHGHHEPGCSCADIHREHVWKIADTAFPDDPHLWNAIAALFALSTLNPHELTDAARRSALDGALQHIQHRADLTSAPLSSLDQIVEQFRQQLGS